MCALRECAVDECLPEEIPRCWEGEGEEAIRSRVHFGGEGPEHTSGISGWSIVNGSGGGASGGKSFVPGDVWSVEAEEGEGVYINLLKNPEGYTGYGGPEAARVWKAFYDAACMEPEDPSRQQCLEERVFTRLLSGLQATRTWH
jgi:Endoplasmic Reticulum Oxidoreductin 1 (ERO1)